MSEILEFIIKIIGLTLSIYSILTIANEFIRGNRIRITHIEGMAKSVEKTRGEIDPRTGEFTPEWVYALRFTVYAQNDGLKMAPQVRCMYIVDHERPKRSGTTGIKPCTNKESILAGQKSDPFIIEFSVQGPLPRPVNLSVHVIGFLAPKKGRICRYDAYLSQNSLGETACSGNGETLGWIKSNLIRAASFWYKHKMRKFGIWLGKKLQIDESILDTLSS